MGHNGGKGQGVGLGQFQFKDGSLLKGGLEPVIEDCLEVFFFHLIFFLNQPLLDSIGL